MTPDARAWSAYKPDALPELPAREGSEGRVIVVAGTDEAIAGGWATEIVLGLARGWAGAGHSVLLIDADLGAPSLHEALSVENETGLTDVMLLRSSLAGVSQGMEGGRFDFISAGSPAADPELAFRGDRWPTLCREAIRVESTLVVFVPYTAPWSGAILEQATDIIVLAATSDEAALDSGIETRVRAVLGVSNSEQVVDELAEAVLVDPLEAMALVDEWTPDTQETSVASTAPAGSDEAGNEKVHWEAVEARAESEAEVEQVEAEDEETEDPLIGTLGGDPLALDRSADLAADDDWPAPEPRGDAPAPSRARRAPVRRRSLVRNPFVWGSTVLLATTFVVIQVMRRSDATEPIAPVETAPPSRPATEPAQIAPSAEAVGPAARFTVALAAYQNFATATSQVETLNARTSDHLFVLAPVEVGGTVYYRLLAGLAPDAATAARLSDALSETLGAPSTSWIVRDAPLAFELARSTVLDVATESRDAVRAQALPAYVLGVDMSDGSMEYRVYVGAYSDDAEASLLRALLNENGLADVPLVERLGTAIR